MKPEKTKTQRRVLTDADRDNALRLIGCGLSNVEIADIMHISDSTVANIRNAHTACIYRDWSTLQKLSTFVRPTVDWAMKLTGADKVFEETFPKEQGETPADVQVESTTAPETITKEDFVSLQNTLQDICYLLTEIRDIIK